MWLLLSQTWEIFFPKRIPSKDASILVCGGGILDKEVFASHGYRNVTISNLDTRAKADDFSPYNYVHEDVQELSFEDSSILVWVPPSKNKPLVAAKVTFPSA